MYLVVAVELVVELVPELREEASLDQRLGGGIDTRLALHSRSNVSSKDPRLRTGITRSIAYLATGKANGDDANVLGVREELGLDH